MTRRRRPPMLSAEPASVAAGSGSPSLPRRVLNGPASSARESRAVPSKPVDAAELLRYLDRQVAERELQECIRKAAKAYRWRYYHTYDSRKSSRGFPDLVLVSSTWGVVFAELKREGQWPERPQAAWLDALEDAPHGPGTYLWWPSDWRTGAIEEVLRRGPQGGLYGAWGSRRHEYRKRRTR